MAEWKTCRERCYLEELASADGKMKVYRQKASRPPVESILEQAEEARSELEVEFGKGAFDSLEYNLHTHHPDLSAYYVWDWNQVLINIPHQKAPVLSDALTVGYSRFFIPTTEAGRLHELYLREACGEALGREDELELNWLMKRVGVEWERLYDLRSADVWRELLRHESTHSLEKNIQPPIPLDELRMKSLTPQEFADQAVNGVLRDGFALFVGYDYEQIIPPVLGGVFRKRLQKMFKRAETMPMESYGRYISGLDPAVLDFAGEYLAGTILRAYGIGGVRKCVTELNQKDILAWHFNACAELEMTPLFDLSEYPYFTPAPNFHKKKTKSGGY